jgi:hypothetical protein
MKGKYFLVITFLVISLNSLVAQNTYDIVFPGKERDQKCQECFQIFNQKPYEVKFSIKREMDNLYFEVNDKNWFDLLFKNAGDGLAVDIVLKERYACENESIEKSQIKGFLLKPVYSQALKAGLKSTGANIYSVLLGKIPNSFLKDELEFNILFLSNKNLCRYYVTYELESYTWDLLDVGMYLDTLTYDPKQIKSTFKDSYVIRNKTLKFIIPFKKNKSNYSQADIKPIYDSLRLTDFNIKAINIKGYSSIEGITSRNLELQKLRANSIVAALQTFQKPTIKTEVSSSENWVEFFNDIKSTKYANLSTLTKKEIKERIAGALSREMEPILENHRKAIIELELEKKDRYRDESADMLLTKFNDAITVEELQEANEIQNSIFEKIKVKEASPTILEKMNIPLEVKFARIFNKNSAYKYILDFKQALIVYNELIDLERLVPNDKNVKYNIVAVKIKLWRFNAISINENDFMKQINELKNYGISNSQISRMMVNFHIIKAENLMINRDYGNKDKSVEYVKTNYKNFPLSDYDYLSLAQFFSYYGNTKMAVDLLESKARSIDIDEDLLFYYLNLTLIDEELTHDSNYRTIMLNAINMNKPRFCKLFNSVENGGVTFQLLDDEYLRNTYCENCKD